MVSTSNIYTTKESFDKVCFYPFIINNDDEKYGDYAEPDISHMVEEKTLKAYVFANYGDVINQNVRAIFEQREFGYNLLKKENLRDGDFGVIVQYMRPGTMSVECKYVGEFEEMYKIYIRYLDNENVRKNMTSAKRDKLIDIFVK